MEICFLVCLRFTYVKLTHTRTLELPHFVVQTIYCTTREQCDVRMTDTKSLGLGKTNSGIGHVYNPERLMVSGWTPLVHTILYILLKGVIDRDDGWI